jgi:hypothetical protein
MTKREMLGMFLTFLPLMVAVGWLLYKAFAIAFPALLVTTFVIGCFCGGIHLMTTDSKKKGK